MQGTVASFDEESRAGSVRLDDGASVDFPAAAFVASGLRLLRPGQRVRLDRDPAGTVVLVTLPTMAAAMASAVAESPAGTGRPAPASHG